MCDCRKCFHFKVCKKAEKVENYKLQGECGEFVDEGLVVELPCKVGEFVYTKFSGTNEIECYVIDKVSHNGSNYFSFDAHLENEDGYVVDILEFDLVDIGITVFSTKTEAEQALSKLQASYEQVKEGAE